MFELQGASTQSDDCSLRAGASLPILYNPPVSIPLSVLEQQHNPDLLLQVENIVIIVLAGLRPSERVVYDMRPLKWLASDDVSPDGAIRPASCGSTQLEPLAAAGVEFY